MDARLLTREEKLVLTTKIVLDHVLDDQDHHRQNLSVIRLVLDDL
jgi:hypothetical protein